MSKIVAIGSMVLPLGLQLTCAGTLSKYVNGGSTLDILMTAGNRSVSERGREQEHQTKGEGMVTMTKRTESLEGMIERSFVTIGASEVRFAHGFDHAGVSQANVDLLKQHIEEVNPAVAVIPFYKSADPITRIVGKSALLACRWVQNVLMYDTAAKPPFRPGIFSVLSHQESQMKNAILVDFGSADSGHTTDDALSKLALMRAFYATKGWRGQGEIEALQSHRVQLLAYSLSEEGNSRGSLFE
jgi:hypothetical protein